MRHNTNGTGVIQVARAASGLRSVSVETAGRFVESFGYLCDDSAQAAGERFARAINAGERQNARRASRRFVRGMKGAWLNANL